MKILLSLTVMAMLSSATVMAGVDYDPKMERQTKSDKTQCKTKSWPRPCNDW